MTKRIKLSSPLIKSGNSEFLLSIDFFTAASPLLIWSFIAYGIRPIMAVAACMVCASLFEALYALILKQGSSIPSAAILGMIIALFMPAGINFIFIPIAALIAVSLRKFTKGVIHPLAAALLPLFFITDMTSHGKVFEPLKLDLFNTVGERAVSMLDILASGEVPEMSELDVFLGNAPESIGAISSVLIIIGGLYLIIRKAIPWQIPAGYLAGATLIWLIVFFDSAHYTHIFYQLAAGSMMLAAFFGATDYSSSPVTSTARSLHGAACGALAVLLRYFGLYAESVLLALLIVSLFSRILDMLTAPRYFGYKDRKIFQRLLSLFPFK